MWDDPCDLCPERAGVYYSNGKFCRAHSDELHQWSVALDRLATAEAGGPFEQKTPCPRRAEGPPGAYPGTDLWEYGHGLITDERLLTCSFCGSVQPEEFLAKVKEGWIVGPTDKSYKAYLSRPLTEEEQAAHKAKWLTGWQAQGVRDHGHSEAEVEETYENVVLPTAQGREVGKFYFQHLSPEQRTEFVALYNDKTMKLGYPGHFYSRPFFVREAG